jgi:hypothetical protein
MWDEVADSDLNDSAQGALFATITVLSGKLLLYRIAFVDML